MTASDLEARAHEVLDLVARQRFATPTARLTATLHDLHAEAEGLPALRCRLAAALARVHADAPASAIPYADEAVELAEGLDSPLLLAHALDARLATRQGPDDLEERLRTSVWLLDVVGHVTDPDVRLGAHLWRLTTALEQLDLASTRRQLAALDVLADETSEARIRFVARSRRAMFALTEGDTMGAARLTAETETAGTAAGDPTVEQVVGALHAELARQRGDREALARAAETLAGSGAALDRPALTATAAVYWLESGERARAGELVDRLADGLDALPSDVDWLPVVTRLCEAASGTDRPDLATRCADLLAPYAGRAVLDRGTVLFAGVVEDYLALATGNPVLSAQARASYDRLGADWWARRGPRRRLLERAARKPATPIAERVLHLHPTAPEALTGSWCVGREAATSVVPWMPGLEHLRLLLDRPGADIDALELAAATPRATDSTVIVGQQAMTAYRRRLREIDDELERAGHDATGDPEKVRRLTVERTALTAQVRSGGVRGERAGGDPSPASVPVTIGAALTRLEQHDRELARELRATISAGATCRYQPDPSRPVAWRLRDEHLAGTTAEAGRRP